MSFAHEGKFFLGNLDLTDVDHHRPSRSLAAHNGAW